jgi:hypothetical protein
MRRVGNRQGDFKAISCAVPALWRALCRISGMGFRRAHFEHRYF